ncbi:reverse transcriptase domain-containing protein [Tanacetum coccineum]
MANPDDELMWAADRIVASTLGMEITIPATAIEFAIKGNHLTLVKENQFDGRIKTDPHKHIHEFIGVCDMFKCEATENEAVRLMMFVQSLTGEAKTWLDELNEGTIVSWDELRTAFIRSLSSNTQPNPRGNSSQLDESSTIIQKKVPPKLGDPGSLLIPCTFSKTFSSNALADLGASIKLMPYSLYAKLSLKVGKFTFPVDFVNLEMEEDNKVHLILGRPFLHTTDIVIRVKQKQLNLGFGSEHMVFSIDSAIKHSYSNDDTCFSIDVIDEILEEDFDALLDEGIKILYSIERTPLKDKIFAGFDEFIAMNIKENIEPKINKEKITFPIHYVPKKGGITIVTNEKDELVPTRTIMGWKVCIDYRKLNEAIAKDHFPLPFMDQMLERLTGNKYFCFLDGFYGYFQIPIDPMDQEKMSFTCPFGTYAYRQMPFGLCNAPATFQRCMLAIFHDMIEESVEVFMDEFSVFGNYFDNCLHNLDKMLKRCKDASLVLNWEKCHFMVKEGIVLGHKVFGAGREHGMQLLDYVKNGPFKFGTVEGLPPDVYTLVNHQKVSKQIWDTVKLLIEGSKLSLQQRESRLYNEFDRFTSEKGETIHSYYLRFVKLINDMNTIGMTMRPLQVNTKFVNHLQLK